MSYDHTDSFHVLFVLLELTIWLPPKCCGVSLAIFTTLKIILFLKQEIWLWTCELECSIYEFSLYFGWFFQIQVKKNVETVVELVTPYLQHTNLLFLC
jgi:hypothetical protein